MNTNVACHLRKMAEQDLAQVLAWRNHDDVRRYMFGSGLIAMEQHQRWFAGATLDSTRALLILERDGVPSGFVNIKFDAQSRVGSWGFYVSPDAPRGTGKIMGKLALAYAFNNLGLHKLCGEVIAFNERSLRFHERLGFTEEGRLRDQYFDGAVYHHVISFGLLAGEWTTTSTDEK